MGLRLRGLGCLLAAAVVASPLQARDPTPPNVASLLLANVSFMYRPSVKIAYQND